VRTKIPQFVENSIYNLAEEAIDNGLSVAELRSRLAEAWDAVLSEKRRYDAKRWEES
jgi:hypothetical protein